ncbi:rhodanese-like domain-containing protein [Novosphingobium guangzhouense]|uniref:Thiosulfate sulfurtransferase n=1 Tax=Novosphingobium guangzhouense TaxID=1850347 RepID=A0A2K2G3D1_9SPHN|nr:rhodanese-like domain-containing protein [Novosphingobium guangzhouense]PNU05536.1 thiosulfate sulfurtransferase [Novosphingobium guangzhouense]
MTDRKIDSQTFATWLDDGAELAVLDIRAKEDAVGYGSPLFGTSLPADRVIAHIDRSVPRRHIRTVLVDGGDGAAERLAAELSAAGWTAIHALEGGFPAWLESGFADRSFDIPGRDFSLGVQAEKGTPAITVQELAERRGNGEDIIVIDTRTVPEYTRDHVPGAVNIPGAELLLRYSEIVPSAETQVVVSCAGLPRAILGAQTLIDAGVPNTVAYLDDGTAAWRRAGWPLEEGLTAKYKAATEASRRFGRDHAAQLPTAGRFPEIDLETAHRWAADPQRTTYLLDVRTPEEYAAEHVTGSLSSEGGQLLGLSSRTIATRGARLVLIDDTDGIRARTVAHWLSRRNFEIAILRHPFGGTAAGERRAVATA